MTAAASDPGNDLIWEEEPGQCPPTGNPFISGELPLSLGEVESLRPRAPFPDPRQSKGPRVQLWRRVAPASAPRTEDHPVVPKGAAGCTAEVALILNNT